jgi:lipopolysaccharide transport system ATP-binding protein
MSAMHDLQGGGRTVLFVSHNMAAVENLCSRGIWLAQGRVQLDGPAHQVIEAYMNTFSSAESASNVLTRTDGRRGSGEVRYTRVDFLSADREPQTVTRSGKGLVIRLHYHANEPIEHMNFTLKLFSELGTLVSETGTWHHGMDVTRVPAGDGYADLEIDSLNLMPGRYYFTLVLGSWAVGRVYDFIENAVYLDVEEAPIYGGSRHLDSRFGLVFFPQRWRLEGIGSGGLSSAKEASAL